MKRWKGMRQAVRYLALGLTVLAVAAGFWWRFERAAPPILIEEATAIPRPGEPGTLAVTLKIVNRGGPDRLLGVASPMTEAGTLALTAAEDSLPVPEEASASLALDGAHVILRNLEGENQPGRLLPLTLRFEAAGDLAAKAVVAEAPSMMMHDAFYPLPPGETAPEIGLEVEAGDEGFAVRIETRHFRFAEELVDQPHQPGTGHAHLYVGGMKLGRLYGPDARINALPPGRHEVLVTLNTNDHRAYVANGRVLGASAWLTVE
jgi:copper(I)-binding protein